MALERMFHKFCRDVLHSNALPVLCYNRINMNTDIDKNIINNIMLDVFILYVIVLYLYIYIFFFTWCLFNLHQE